MKIKFYLLDNKWKKQFKNFKIIVKLWFMKEYNEY